MAATKKTARRKTAKQSFDAHELLVTELREIHSAEKQLSRILPRVAKAADSDQARELIEERIERGESLIEDIENALEELDSGPGRKKNVAAEGLVDDMREHLQETEPGPSLDAVTLSAALKTEHYCIGAWQAAKSLARGVGERGVVSIMDREIEAGEDYGRSILRLVNREIGPALMNGRAQEEDEDAGRRQNRSGGERRASA